MIMTAFDVKFRGRKDGKPPRACRPLKKLKKNDVEKVDLEKVKKNNVDKEGPPPVRPSGGCGGRSPLGIYIYI